MLVIIIFGRNIKTFNEPFVFHFFFRNNATHDCLADFNMNFKDAVLRYDPTERGPGGRLNILLCVTLAFHEVLVLHFA